ncbi:MAG: hypothetical protein AB4038_10385 [Prochloraceae cyanobacterium]
MMQAFTTKKNWIIIASTLTVLTLVISFIVALNNANNEKEEYQQRLQKENLMEEINYEFDRNKDIDG